MAGVQDQLEIKFRLTDGSDIGPKSFPAATSVVTLKESILAQWPKGWFFQFSLKTKNFFAFFFVGCLIAKQISLSKLICKGCRRDLELVNVRS